MNELKLKSLKSQLRIRSDEYETLKFEAAQKQKECADKKKAILIIEDEIRKLEPQQLTVSEHAIIRYLERVRGEDISLIEKEILNEKIVSMVNVLGGNGLFPCDGFNIKISNYKVITVLTP